VTSNRRLRAGAAVVGLTLAGACGNQTPAPPTPPSTQYLSPGICPPRPYDEAAIALVVAAQNGDRSHVSGSSGTSGLRYPPENFASRPNPKGPGVVVSGFYVESFSGGKIGYAMTLAGWLVLDGTIYPLNDAAASSVGRGIVDLSKDVQSGFASCPTAG
jgi:hypothetical protein